MKTPGRMPAFERYDRQFYRIIRRAIREGCFRANLDILIISAKFGLLAWDTEIEDYDQFRSKEQAHKLRPSIQENLESFLDGRDYDKLFINMGVTYLETLEGFEWRKHLKQKTQGEHEYAGDIYIILHLYYNDKGRLTHYRIFRISTPRVAKP